MNLDITTRKSSFLLFTLGLMAFLNVFFTLSFHDLANEDISVFLILFLFLTGIIDIIAVIWVYITSVAKKFHT